VSHRARTTLLLPALGVFGALLVWGFTGLPDFGDFAGHYSGLLKAIAVPQRHATNVVAAVNWDYRGVDTLGEEYILFTAVAGVVLLLRHQAEKPEEAVDSVGSDTLRLVGVLLVAPAIVVGLWLVAFGTVTPGGGFQGGVALAGGSLLLYLVWNYRSWHRATREHWLDPFEASGVAGYVAIGLAGLVAGSAFLFNLFGYGKQGTLYGGGTIVFINWATAVEVTGANLLLFAEFLKAYVVPLARAAE
jgi:multicomponent Na+:H+ antiporter subunit B